MDAFNITAPSPDAQHLARLLFSGEIRFGPAYYALELDGYSFGDRIFGEAHLWAPSSRYLAVQEWLTLDYSEGPITVLVLIDAQQRREAAIVRITKGFCIPEGFDGSTLAYGEEYAGAITKRAKVDAAKITGWKALG